ncbi:MAG: UbiA family prenyltransferase [Thermodesulfobacteriota bacterium]
MTPKTRLHPWFSLLRLPNLLTVPGDPLAGYILAGGSLSGFHDLSLLFLGCLSALFLYCFGLIQNDLTDMDLDRRERPSRPIVSGAISVPAAFAAMAAAGLAGTWIALSAGRAVFAAAFVLFVLINAYNLWAKALPIRGPAFMGACRAASLFLGAALAPQPASLVSLLGAVTLFSYITAVSVLSRQETRSHADLSARFYPVLALGLGLLAVYVFQDSTGAGRIAFLVFGAAALANATQTTLSIGPGTGPAEIQRSIGKFLRGLLLMQAAFASSGGGWGILLGAILAAAVFPASRLAQRFAPS